MHCTIRPRMSLLGAGVLERTRSFTTTHKRAARCQKYMPLACFFSSYLICSAVTAPGQMGWPRCTHTCRLHFPHGKAEEAGGGDERSQCQNVSFLEGDGHALLRAKTLPAKYSILTPGEVKVAYHEASSSRLITAAQMRVRKIRPAKKSSSDRKSEVNLTIASYMNGNAVINCSSWKDFLFCVTAEMSE